MSLSIPNVFVGGAGNKAKASEVNGNFNAVAAKFTEGAGGISDGDISATAGIKGSKLSGVAGTRITASQMDDDAVDLRVLKDDINSGSPNAAVNNANHIKDGIITNAKLVAGTLKKGSLAVGSVLITVPIIGGAGVSEVATGLTLAAHHPTMIHSEFAGAAYPGFIVVMRLHLNTTTGLYDLACANLSAGSSTAFNVRIYYITI